MTYMLDEIGEQPDAVRRVIERLIDPVDELAAEIKRRNISLVYIAARGSSDHAAVYCKYVLEIKNSLPVALANPSAFTLYHSAPRLTEQTLVIGVSQSGAGPDVIEVITQARRAGALTACIINQPGSALAAASQFALHLDLGRERSVAATKTYTASLAAIALLSARLSGSAVSLSELISSADSMDRALLLETAAADAAALCKDMRECVVLARGFNQATALEASLKLVETCYVGARAYSGADFLHGPIAQMEEGLTCLLFAPSGDTLESMLSLAQRLGGISEKIVCFSDNSELLSIGHAGLLAPTVPEWLSPLVYIIPAQLFACRLALKRGLNPDTPRGLNKVTMTV